VFKSAREKSLEAEIEKLQKQIDDTSTDKRIKALEEERDQRTKMFHEKEEKLVKEIAELRNARTKIEQEFKAEKALAYKTMELEFKQKQMDEVQKVKDEYEKKLRAGMEDNFKHLQSSLTKLHEEGNAQTKFVQDLALNITKGMVSQGPVLPNTKPAPKQIANGDE
jgi:murein L,D-transpeptidase YcbB/YkuD